jgi:hypothetical protein
MRRAAVFKWWERFRDGSRGQNCLFHYPPEACGKLSAARFREVGIALWEVNRLSREVLRKRDRHRTSTKFRLGVIRWVHELSKRPSMLQPTSRTETLWVLWKTDTMIDSYILQQRCIYCMCYKASNETLNEQEVMGEKLWHTQNTGRVWEFFSSPPRLNWLWDPPSLLYNG